MKKWILNNDGMTQAFRHMLYRSAINVAVGVINMFHCCFEAAY